MPVQQPTMAHPTDEELENLEVDTADLQKESVTAEKIGPEAVVAAKIKSEAVTPAKLGTVTWKGVSAAHASLESAGANFEAAENALVGDGLVAFRGASKVKAAAEVKAGEKLFSINAETRPTKERLLGFAVLKKAKEGKGIIVANINTAGEVFAEQAILAEETVAYDGIVYSL